MERPKDVSSDSTPGTVERMLGKVSTYDPQNGQFADVTEDTNGLSQRKRSRGDYLTPTIILSSSSNEHGNPSFSLSQNVFETKKMSGLA